MSLLLPVIILAFISFAFSAFVILRILISILPPSPLSRRVSPAEFGLPNFRSLSLADESHLWLASFDIVALLFFVWQVAAEYASGPLGLTLSSDPASTVRLWLALTMRQACLLVVVAVTLMHVRLGQSVTFGAKHWMLWAPTFVLIAASVSVAAIFATTGLGSFFIGLVTYSSVISVSSTVALACLVGTLFIIKRNLAALNEASDPWPPASSSQVEAKPRPSFATEDVDALRAGSSWITSSVGSRRESMSNWSFSTHNTKRSGNTLPKPIPAKSSFWCNAPSTTNLHIIPPAPTLPSPCDPMSPTGEVLSDPDPFRRVNPSDLSPVDSHHPRDRFGSQTSWLTSTDGTRPTLPAWSFPTQSHASLPELNDNLLPSPRAIPPALSSAKILGGYGYNPQNEAEHGLAALATPGTEIDISIVRVLGWFVMIWVPSILALPHLFTVSNGTDSVATYILLALSVTISSPILAFNVICRCPVPIPDGLFEIRGSSSPERMPYSSSETRFSHEYKRSGSITVVEGRRSGDVWLSNGDATESRTKLGRALSMLAPIPKLSVLPPGKSTKITDITPIPPLPNHLLKDENDTSGVKISATVTSTPVSRASAEQARVRKESKASSHSSGDQESFAHATRIMIAQRHAQTVHVAASPDRRSVVAPILLVTTTGIDTPKRSTSSHMRCRSITSALGVPTAPISLNPSPSPPPSIPIPPTPPNVRAARLATLKHKKTFSSSSEFSFGIVDDVNELHALTAGVFPILVPGLKVGKEMKIKAGDYTAPASLNGKSKNLPSLDEFGLPQNTPPVGHSTSAGGRNRKQSGHKKNHLSLPSLGLGKEGIHSLSFWTDDVKSALESRVGQYTTPPMEIDLNRRVTVWGGAESAASVVKEIDEGRQEAKVIKPARQTVSTRLLGLPAEVPHGVESSPRTSIATTIVNPPSSASSTATLFEDFEAGLSDGPLAQSTPHKFRSGKPSKANLYSSKERQPTTPLESVSRNSHRSSIVYIRSNEPVLSATFQNDPSPTMFSRWPARAVKPPSPSKSKTTGLRPLSILKNCDESLGLDSHLKGVRPPVVSKKSRKSKANKNGNSPPDPAKVKGLKPLSLVRSETAKERGRLREREPLPKLIIRPPSIDVDPYDYSSN